MSTATLGTDDLACVNIWKSDLGEIHGITFKFWGKFTATNQGVIRYLRSEARFKSSVIDVEGSSWSGDWGGLSMLYCDRAIETYGCEIKLPTAPNPLLAFDLTNASGVAIKVTGNPRGVGRVSGTVVFENLEINGAPTYLFDNRAAADVSVIGTSKVSAASLRRVYTDAPPFRIFFGVNVTIQSPLTQVVNRQYIFSDSYHHHAYGVRVQAPNGLSKIECVNSAGTVSAGLGKYQSQGSGLDLSGDGVNHHWSVDGGGAFYPTVDDSRNIGYASKRVKNVYMVNTAVVGSDERIKSDVASIPQEICDFVLSTEIKQYR
ncbi:MAG: hypothetical protein ACRC49_06300, partial [Plesiomonas sp.]